jgi:hypothetical protein
MPCALTVRTGHTGDKPPHPGTSCKAAPPPGVARLTNPAAALTISPRIAYFRRP